jgi:hypothetical protein
MVQESVTRSPANQIASLGRMIALLEKRISIQSAKKDRLARRESETELVSEEEAGGGGGAFGGSGVSTAAAGHLGTLRHRTRWSKGSQPKTLVRLRPLPATVPRDQSLIRKWPKTSLRAKAPHPRNLTLRYASKWRLSFVLQYLFFDKEPVVVLPSSDSDYTLTQVL